MVLYPEAADCLMGSGNIARDFSLCSDHPSDFGGEPNEFSVSNVSPWHNDTVGSGATHIWEARAKLLLFVHGFVPEDMWGPSL